MLNKKTLLSLSLGAIFRGATLIRREKLNLFFYNGKTRHTIKKSGTQLQALVHKVINGSFSATELSVRNSFTTLLFIAFNEESICVLWHFVKSRGILFAIISYYILVGF